MPTPSVQKRVAVTTRGGKQKKQKVSETSGKGSDDAQSREVKGSATAHDTRLSLSTAYAQNAKAKVGYLTEKLQEEKRQ